MKKVIKLTESDLIKVVKRVINESEIPVNTQFWKNMLNDIEGDNVTVTEEIPNKKLVINAFGNTIYTITKTNVPTQTSFNNKR